MSDRPRFAKKEVRQFARWLEKAGWEYDGDDADQHTIWIWPATGYRMKLPSTPRGGNWVGYLRKEANRAMGTTKAPGTPNHRRSKKKVERSGFRVTASDAQRTAETIDRLYEERDVLIQALAECAANPSYQSADNARDDLERIRRVEHELSLYGQNVTPFDLEDLQEVR